ncbi:MAG: HEAT repeat domain-containing protein [Pirellulales bacterium]
MEHCSSINSGPVLQRSVITEMPRVSMGLFLLVLLSFPLPSLADDTIDAIRSELKSESVRKVDECIHNLTPQQVQTLTPELCDLADGSQDLVRWSALRRLSQSKPIGSDLQQRVISVFVKQLSHDEHAFRQAAIEGLVRVGEPAVQPLLKELDQSRSVSKSAAAFTLVRLKLLPIATALKLSRDSDPRVRYAAIQALDDSVESMAELQRLIADPEVSVAVAAANFVSLKIAHPSPELVTALVSGLEREDFKTSAASALVRLGSLAQQAIPAIIRANPQESSYRLGSRSSWGEVAPQRFVYAFMGNPKTELLDELIELLDSENLTVAKFAATEISRMGTEAGRAASTIERRLIALNANPPKQRDESGPRVDPRPEFIHAIWAVTHDFEILAKYSNSTSWVSSSDRHEDDNTLFLQLTKLSEGEILDKNARRLIHRLRHDKWIVAELETRLRDSQSRNRKCLAEAYLRLLKNPTDAQKDLIVALHNEELLSTEEIARRITQDISFSIPKMRDPIGKLLLSSNRHQEYLSEAWIALADDREAAMSVLLANPSVNGRCKAKAIGKFKRYNSQSMDFLKQQIYSTERWEQIYAIEAVGLAGERATPLVSDLRKILEANRRQWMTKNPNLDLDTKYHDFDFESAVGLALYRIDRNEKLLVQLIEGCRANDKFVLHMLVKLLTAAGGNLKSVEAQIFEGLDQTVTESIETIIPDNQNIAKLGRIALAVNPEAARAKLEELRVHRVYFIRETAVALLKKGESASGEVEQ